MTEYETLMSSIVIKPKGSMIFDVDSTTVALDDEGDGMFVTVDKDDRKICITRDEWPHLIDSIELLLELCDDQKREIVGKWNLKSGCSISFSKDDGNELVGQSDAVANRPRPD